MDRSIILYDAACKVCNAEIEFYKKRDHQSKFVYQDIMEIGLDVSKYDLSKKEVHKYFHVIKNDGEVLRGVEAFSFIWSELKMFKVLQVFSQNIIGNKIMNIGYHFFVKIRSYLPRNKDCDYCLTKES